MWDDYVAQTSRTEARQVHRVRVRTRLVDENDLAHGGWQCGTCPHRFKAGEHVYGVEHGDVTVDWVCAECLAGRD